MKFTRITDAQQSSGQAAWITLLALVAMMPWVTSITRAAGMWAITDEPYHLPKLILLASLVGIASVLWILDVVRLRTSRISAALIVSSLLAVWMLVSTAFSANPASALFGAIGLSTGAITWILCIMMLFYIEQYVHRAKRLEQLSWAFISGSSISAAIAVLASLGHDPLATPFAQGQRWMVTLGMGTTGNPNFTGTLMIVPTLVALGLVLNSTSTWRKALAGACCALMGVCTFITLSRGAWIGVLIGLVAFVALEFQWLRESPKRWLALAAGFAATVAVGWKISYGPNVIERFASTGAGAQAASSGRVGLWKDTIGIIFRHPLFGTGADQLALGGYHVQTHPMIIAGQRFVLQDPHDLPLLIAGVFGIPALLLAIVLLTLVLKESLPFLKSERRSAIYAAWFAGFAGFLVASLASVWTITAIFVLMLSIAVLISPATIERQAPVGVAIVSGVIALALVSAGLYGSTKSFMASREVALSNVDDPPAHFARAIALAPWDTNIRVKYYVRKIYGLQQQIAGPDASLSISTVDQIDAELGLEIARFPDELLFYRLRMVLLEMPKGTPGYRQDKLEAALQQAVLKFPNDPEFRDKLAELEKGEPSK